MCVFCSLRDNPVSVLPSCRTQVLRRGARMQATAPLSDWKICCSMCRRKFCAACLYARFELSCWSMTAVWPHEACAKCRSECRSETEYASKADCTVSSVMSRCYKRCPPPGKESEAKTHQAANLRGETVPTVTHEAMDTKAKGFGQSTTLQATLNLATHDGQVQLR